jgi:Ni/Co efflux regulator RcnB
MRKLALVSLAAIAAAAALPAAASAQPRAPQHQARMGGQAHGVQMHRGNVQHRRFGHVQRFQRGHVVPPVWMGPRFQVRHWQVYGFPAPQPGWRWVRYYDDALLLDHRGRVMDGRYGFDWDRYGDRWDYDDRGAPYYAGDYDDYDDYADREEYEERYERRGDRHDGPRHPRGGGWDYSEYGRCDCGPGPGPGYPPPPPPPGYGHGYGYGHSGYGYGYGYGGATRTIVETTVETGGTTVIEEEVIEERVVHRPRRVVRRAPPPRRPIRGERG